MNDTLCSERQEKKEVMKNLLGQKLVYISINH